VSVPYFENSQVMAHTLFISQRRSQMSIRPCYARVCPMGKAEEQEKSCGHTCCSHSNGGCFCYAGSEKRFLEIVKSVHGHNIRTIAENIYELP